MIRVIKLSLRLVLLSQLLVTIPSTASPLGELDWPTDRVDELTEALHHSDPQVRVQALVTLSNSNQLTWTSLSLCLKDPSPQVRRLAADILPNLKDQLSIPDLLKALEDSDEATGHAVVQVLKDLDRPGVLPKVMHLIQDPRPVVRAHALLLFGFLSKPDDPKARNQVAIALYDTAPELRAHAIMVLDYWQGPTDFQALKQALQDPDARVRSAAIIALSKYPRPSVKQLLQATLEDSDPTVRKAAIQSHLTSLSSRQIVTDLIRMTGDVDARVRLAAVSRLNLLRDNQAKEEIWTRLSPPNSLAREESYLGEFEFEGIMRHLFQDPEPELRIQALKYFSYCGSKLGRPYLLKGLNDPDHQMRFNAALSLSSRRYLDGAAIPVLMTSLEADDPKVRQDSTEALTELLTVLKERAMIPNLIKLLGQQNSKGRASAALVLGEIGDTHAIPSLLAALADRDTELQVNAAEALGQLRAKEALPALRKALTSPNKQLRVKAAIILKHMNDKVSVPNLIQALTDSDPHVRAEAMYALASMQATEAVPALLKTLGDSNPRVRQHAISILGNWDIPAVEKGLNEHLKDPDARVREASSKALALREQSVPQEEFF